MAYNKIFQYTCGHELTTEVATKEESGYVKIPTPCTDCRKAEQKKRLTKSELVSACEPLKAVSEKQCEYAETNRMRFINHWVSSASDTQAEIIRKIIKNETRASWWLDNLKQLNEDQFVNSYTPKPKKPRKPKEAEESKDAKRAKMLRILKENLIRPRDIGCTETEKQIVNLIIEGDYVYVKTVKGCCLQEILPKFTQYEDFYARRITEFTGAAQDRLVESSICLLNAGHPVLVMDGELRKRILLKKYIPERTRWFKKQGENTITLSWDGYDRLLCNRALAALPGATWDNDYKIVRVPIQSIKSIKAFAAVNNVSISSSLQELM